MGYLIIREVEGNKVASATRHKLATPTFAEMREKIEKAYPGHVICDPFQSLPGGIRLSVYTSRRKDGVGRCGSSFFSWAVKKKS